MSIIPTADAGFGFTGPEGRRSTRIERPVPLLITGHDGLGQSSGSNGTKRVKRKLAVLGLHQTQRICCAQLECWKKNPHFG